MSTKPDWIGMEAGISSLLPRSGVARERERLLARLDEYASAAIREARTFGPKVPDSSRCDRALDWLLRPVFICGHHRSGTTLLQSLLDGHPQILTLPSEGTYFSSFAYVSARKPSDRDIDRFAAEWVVRFVDPNFEPHFRLGYCSGDRSPSVDFARELFGWHEALQSRVPGPFAPLLALAAAFRAIAAPECEPHAWAEKTPRNERFIARFAPFDAARFVHVVRDPRATLASLEAIYGRARPGKFDAAAAAREIADSLRRARRNARRFGDRYLVVRYEDLVRQPASEMASVQQLLGISPDPNRLVPTAGGREVRANSAYDEQAAGRINPMRDAVPLPPKQLELLAAFAGKVARPFGYDLLVPGAAARAAVRLRHGPKQVASTASAIVRAVSLRFRLRDGLGHRASRP